MTYTEEPQKSIQEWHSWLEHLLVILSEEHGELLHARHTLTDLIDNPNHSYFSVAALFLQISQMIRVHTKREELIMRIEFYHELDSLGYMKHIEEHQTALEKLDLLHNEFLKASNDNYISVAQHMCELLLEVEKHFATTDSEFIRFCHQNDPS